ncbi:MAG: FMN-binding negative transcriptional regulator [Acidobacteria bacterium]|nr:FMN-binding negative transcriptional regulator [Acidobacteriota bacterium]
MDAVYVPLKFHLSDDEAWDVVADVGAATLVRATAHGLDSAFAPVIVSDNRLALYSHLAKANPWWRDVESGAEVLALFTAASAYVSPLDYPSRDENPDLVPTWNYILVQVRGRVHVREELEWKLHQVRELTHQFEVGHEPEWLVDDMDPDFRSTQLKAIVGLEIEVVSIEGKAKLSQNRPEIDRVNVQAAFTRGTPAQQIVAQKMKATPHDDS